MNYLKRATLQEASEAIGISAVTLSAWLRQGTCPFGECIKQGKRNYYIISWKKLIEYKEEWGL